MHGNSNNVALQKVRMAVTDVDGVHTDDRFYISKTSDGLNIETAGITQKLVPCNGDGVPSERFLQLSSGADGRIEGYFFFTGDGIVIKECLRHDIPVVLISGRKSPTVRQRAEDLGARCLQGVEDKVAAVEALLKEFDIGWDEVLFIGNDIQDISLIRRAGFSAAPQDAAPEARAEVDYVTKAKGGYGVVREVLQMLLDVKGLWKPIIARHRTLG